MIKNKYPIIAINDDYRILKEPNNRTLQKHITEKVDPETKEIISCDIWTDIAYCANVYQCLSKVMNDVEITSDCEISVLIERMDAISENLKEVAAKYEQ